MCKSYTKAREDTPIINQLLCFYVVFFWENLHLMRSPEKLNWLSNDRRSDQGWFPTKVHSAFSNVGPMVHANELANYFTNFRKLFFFFKLHVGTNHKASTILPTHQSLSAYWAQMGGQLKAYRVVFLKLEFFNDSTLNIGCWHVSYGQHIWLPGTDDRSWWSCNPTGGELMTEKTVNGCGSPLWVTVDPWLISSK